MKKILSFLALSLLLVAVLAFASLNMTTVRVDYYLGRTEAPVAVMMAAALGLGAALGLLAALGVLLGQKRTNARLQRRCAICEQEIRNLRQIPIQDKH